MKDFTFCNPVTAVMGEAALEKLAEVASGKTVLLVYGGSSAERNGSLSRVTGIIEDSGGAVVGFGGVTQCTYEAIAEGTAKAHEADVDMVVGLGGASAMDTAKAVAFCAVHDNYDEYLEGRLPQQNDEKLSLALIPTYPSTGSEANGVSDIMGYSGGIHGVFADYALLYPPFTYSLDARNTAYGTMVMLAQTGYRFFTDENHISRGCTAASLRAVLAAFDTLCERPDDYDARASMLWASFMETSGLLGLSMEGNWTYSIFSAAGLLRFTRGTVYRENLAMILPRWLVWAAKHHPEEVRAFAIEVFGAPSDSSVDSAVRYAYERMMSILRVGGLPVALEDIPSREDVFAATGRVSSKEFTPEEYFAMVSACATADFDELETASSDNKELRACANA